MEHLVRVGQSQNNEHPQAYADLVGGKAHSSAAYMLANMSASSRCSRRRTRSPPRTAWTAQVAHLHDRVDGAFDAEESGFALSQRRNPG